MITEVGGENDSQVAVASAQWGKLAEVVRADHLELVGWSLALSNRATCRPFDHFAFYRKVVKNAVERM
jgi:triacylglycerol lipase